MGEWVGRELELTPTTLAHGGSCVARDEGRVVFVADAIPGERVLARVTDDRKATFWRAETVRVLEPSPHRQEHVWDAASLERDPDRRAGGAELGHIGLAHQRELKAGVLAEALERFAHLGADGLPGAIEVEPVPGEDARGLRWRTRMRLHVDRAGRIGPYAARSHTVVDASDLPLATRNVERAAALEERAAPRTRAIELVHRVSGPGLRIEEGPDARGRTPATIREQVGERSFALADTGFWQVHRGAPALLRAAVRDAVDPVLLDPDAQHLDLYGGVGLLTAGLADAAPDTSLRITSVEGDATASGFAAGNLADLGARTIAATVEDFLDHTLATASAAERGRLRAGTVVLDPPRSGAGLPVIDALAELAPAQLVYVACDPVALARDTGRLREHGYELTRLRAFDLFPNTHHLEAVAAFQRGGESAS